MDTFINSTQQMKTQIDNIQNTWQKHQNGAKKKKKEKRKNKTKTE